MFGMLFPIILQETIQNKTFDINFTDKGALYKLEIKDINVESMYFQTKTITFVENKPNTIRVNISGFDMFMKIDGAIYALWFIPLKFGSINATGMSLIVDLEAVVNDDQVNWQLKEVSTIGIKDFRIKVTSGFFQEMINLFHGPILKAVKSMLPKITQEIDTIVAKLNVMLQNHDDHTFDVDVLKSGSPMNLTMTKAPIMDATTGLISVNFAATFYDMIAQTNHVEMPKSYGVRRADALGNSQQIFIHQSMLSSLFFALD